MLWHALKNVLVAFESHYGNECLTPVAVIFYLLWEERGREGGLEERKRESLCLGYICESCFLSCVSRSSPFMPRK